MDMQVNRHMAVATPLGGDVLMIKSMSVFEELSQPFRFKLVLLSERKDIRHEDLLGQNMTVRLDVPGNKARLFNGYVAAFSYAGTDGDYTRYTATLCPWLWFLQKTTDCRIFQNETVPQMIKKVFEEQGFTDIDDKLAESYRTWDYCVQYRESDFNFVSRLMEQEGIYYYFMHTDGKHRLVLADGYGSHHAMPGYEVVPYYPFSKSAERADHVTDWSVVKSVQTGKVETTDYNFENPRADLSVRNIIEQAHDNAGFSAFDYPGEYAESGEGDTLIRRHMEAIASRYESVSGTGEVRGFSAGHLFKLDLHPRKDQNREYLIVSARMSLENNSFRTGGGAGSVSCTIDAIESKVPYRAPRRASKVLVQGPQTAVVVGPEGEEIYTDKYGRVKVQFHWDRYGKANQDSSCWVRVSQIAAGRGWGAMTVPRIGQEVIVDFLEGDPDRPIVTGRVYNGENMPPYALPDNATLSTFKSNSSKGGGGFNELRFEDKKGAEQIFVHAQRDRDVRVKHDEREWIGNDAHRIVKRDLFEQVENDHHATVKGDRLSRVEGSASLTVDHDQNEKVGSRYGLEVGEEIHIRAGSKIVLDAGASVTIRVGGSFVSVTPAGIDVSGMFNLNGSGSAGSGAGAAPGLPATPALADDDEAGQVASPAPLKTAVQDEFTKQSVNVLLSAAANGTPFCEICNKA